MEKEIRNYRGAEIRNTDEGSRRVEGYAVVFNSLSDDLGGFREVILPSAFDGILEQSDVLALLDHDATRGILARYKQGVGSLTLEIDDIGLKYSFDAPHTSLGEELLEYLRRGDITCSSFSFVCKDDDWSMEDDGLYIRTIKSIKGLYDVSPVYNPAYQATSVAIAERSLDKFKAVQLDEYYKQKRNRIKHIAK